MTVEAERSVLVSHARFDLDWPWVSEAFRTQWGQLGPLECVRLEPDDARAVHEVVADPAGVRRLVVLGASFTEESVAAFTGLREAALLQSYGEHPAAEALRSRGVKVYRHGSEGFWGQSVAEYGLALTLCGLRRIPQLHHQMLDDLAPWDYSPPDGVPRPGARGGQYGDDPRFTAGTVAARGYASSAPATSRAGTPASCPRSVPMSRRGIRTPASRASTGRARGGNTTSNGWCGTPRSSPRWCR